MALLQQLPVALVQAAGGVAVLEASSRSSGSTAFLSSGSHVGVVCDHVSFPYFLGGGYRPASSPRSHFRKFQGNDLIPSHRFSRGRQDSGYGVVPRADAQGPEEPGFSSRSDSRGNNWNPEFSSGNRQNDNSRNASRFDSRRGDFNPDSSPSGGRQEAYGTPRSDSRRSQGHQFNPQQSSGGGGRQSGYRDAPPEGRGARGNDYYPQRFSGDYGAASRGSDSRRPQQRSNYNPQRTFSDGNGNSDATSRSYSRRSQENDYNSSQRSRPAGNAGPRDGSRAWDARGQGRGGKVSSSARRSSSKTPNPVSQTFTPRQSTSQFVSDRSIHRAPWEQGPSKRSSGVDLERITSVRNPLIERLKRMQAEIAADDAEDAEDAIDDEDGIEGDGFRPTLDRGFKDFDDEARFDGSRENSAMARIVDRLSKIPGSREVYRPQGRGGPGLLDETDSTAGPQYGKPMFPDVGREWSTPDNPVPTPAAPSPSQRFRPDTRFPWEREEARGDAPASEKFTRVKPPSLAELTLPEDELKRLRSLGILSRHRIKVGKLGVTNGIVESMHNEWRNSEVVRVKCEGPPAQNMKRTHETLEVSKIFPLKSIFMPFGVLLQYAYLASMPQNVWLSSTASFIVELLE